MLDLYESAQSSLVSPLLRLMPIVPFSDLLFLWLFFVRLVASVINLIGDFDTGHSIIAYYIHTAIALGACSMKLWPKECDSGSHELVCGRLPVYARMRQSSASRRDCLP
jgi:hypothetical protein